MRGKLQIDNHVPLDHERKKKNPIIQKGNYIFGIHSSTFNGSSIHLIAMGSWSPDVIGENLHECGSDVSRFLSHVPVDEVARQHETPCINVTAESGDSMLPLGKKKTGTTTWLDMWRFHNFHLREKKD